MLSSIAITRTFLEGKNNFKNKHNIIVTSTPIKKRIVQQMEMEWLSPVEKNSKSPHIPIQENTNLEKIKEAESVDKICLVSQRGPKVKEARQLIIMDSDEEEIFWTNRNKPPENKKHTINENEQLLTNAQRSTRKKKTQDKVENISIEPTVERTVNVDSQNHGTTPPKNAVNLSKSVASTGKRLRKKSQAVPLAAKKQRTKPPTIASKNVSIDESPQDSDQFTSLEPSSKKRKKISEDDGSTLRRSTRQRCKPLEFWNGIRMNIDTDFTTGVARHKYNHPQKKVQKVRGRRESETKLEKEELEQNHQIPTNSQNSTSTRKTEANLTKKSKKNKKMSILKSTSNISSKTNVRFSAIGTGTTINGPTRKINVKPDWVVNFAGLHSVKQPLSDPENYLVFPGLKTAMGIISSALMRMPPKAVNHSRAPDLHHLIFCVMVGTVTVAIDEISIRMKTYGHFSVPCGVSYSIKNTSKTEAILSFFKVSCSCRYKE